MLLFKKMAAERTEWKEGGGAGREAIQEALGVV